MKSQYITVSDRIDMEINVAEHIDEIMKVILEDEALCAKIATQHEANTKYKTELLAKYPEIEQYKIEWDKLFIVSANDKSYFITDKITLFSKRHTLDIENQDIEWKIIANHQEIDWKIIANHNDEEKKLATKFIEFLNNKLDPSINNEKQFTKTDGDFIIQFKTC